MIKLRLVMSVVLVSAITVMLSACIPRATPVKPTKIRIGTIPSVDALPLWAAQRDGLMRKAGLNVVLYTFPSTQDRDNALSEGAIDGVVGDLIEIASERSKGTTLKAVTVVSGDQPPNRHVGLVVAPRSKTTSLKQLAGIPIGTSLGTLQEYVLDTLMARAGVPESQIKTTEVKKVPVRFGLLMSGQVPAAMLGEPYLSLAIEQGARLVADDSTGPNLSQEVLDFREDYLSTPQGEAAVKKLLEVWDEEVARINANPNAYKDLLVERAGVPKTLSKTFGMGTYPRHHLPTQTEVGRLLTWMRMKHLISKQLTYAEMVWQPASQ